MSTRTKPEPIAAELVDAYAEREAVERNAAEVRDRVAAAERAAHAERQARRRAVWQGFLDGYDPQALQLAVATTADALRSAVAESDLGRALVAHTAAQLRQATHTSLAHEAVDAGATPAVPLNGRAVEAIPGGDLYAFTAGLLAPIVGDLALVAVQAEEEAVRTATEQAYRSVHVAEPSGYRVESARSGDYSDTIGGGGTVRFADGVAYVMRGAVGDEALAAMVRYWRSVPESYTVTEVYGSVPTDHTDALRRVA